MKTKNMNKIIKVFVLIFISSVYTGCAGFSCYVVDRCRDAADTVTLTAGYGGGVKARIGPIGTGLFVNQDKIGLRGGQLFYVDDVWRDEWVIRERRDIPREMASIIPSREYWPKFCYEYFNLDDVIELRHKSYESSTYLPQFFYVLGDESECYDYAGFYGQIEAAAGFGYTVRIGMNWVEMIDFTLGILTIDIMNDDLELDDHRKAR